MWFVELMCWALPCAFVSCRLAYKASGEPFWPDWVRRLASKSGANSWPFETWVGIMRPRGKGKVT